MEDQSSNYFYKQKTISNRIFKRNPFIVENLDKDIFTSDFNKESKEADEMFTFGSMWKVEHKIFKKYYSALIINKSHLQGNKEAIKNIDKAFSFSYKYENPYFQKLFSHNEENNFILLILQDTVNIFKVDFFTKALNED